MSRLWDTPEFWVRTETDELLRDYPATDVSALADSLARTSANFDGDPEFAGAIVTELRKRAAAGVRFWPNPTDLPSLQAELSQLVTDAGHIEWQEPQKAWWQRM